MTGFGTNANATQAVISLSAYVNPLGSSSQTNIIGYSSATTLTAGPPAVNSYVIPASTTSTFALATLLAAYTAPVFVSIAEVAQSGAGLGFLITTVSGSGRVGVGPNGFWCYVGDGATALPTVYITNSSSTTELVVSIGVLSQ